jgi:hypothetical protein
MTRTWLNLDWHLLKFSQQFYKLKALTTQKQVKVPLRPTPPIPDRALLYLKIPRLEPLLRLLGIVTRWRWVRNIMSIIMTGVNHRTRRTTCLNATVSNTNPTRTGQELNTSFRRNKKRQSLRTLHIRNASSLNRHHNVLPWERLIA